MSKIEYKYLKGVKKIEEQIPKEFQHCDEQTEHYESGSLEEFESLYDTEATSTPLNPSIENNESLEDNESIENNEGTESFSNTLDLFGDDMYNDEPSPSTEQSEPSTEPSEQSEPNSDFSESMYKLSSKILNTEEFIQYNIDYNNKVSAKEARTSIETRLPFIVDKNTSGGNTRSVLTDSDSIYRLETKMRKTGEQNEFNISSSHRIGFIKVSSNSEHEINFNTTPLPTRPSYKTKRLNNKVVGLLNERFIIRRKRPFNTKKLGYLPVTLADIQTLNGLDEKLDETENMNKRQQLYFDRLYQQKKLLEEAEINRIDNVQNYVEIVESKGAGALIFLIALIIVIWFIIYTIFNNGGFKNWHFNPKNFNVFKTQEQTIEKDTNIEFTMNATPTYQKEQNTLNLNMTTVSKDDVYFTVDIQSIDGTKSYYESDKMKSGDSLESIGLTAPLAETDQSEASATSKELLVICKTYKLTESTGEYIYLGELEQQISVTIK